MGLNLKKWFDVADEAKKKAAAVEADAKAAQAEADRVIAEHTAKAARHAEKVKVAQAEADAAQRRAEDLEAPLTCACGNRRLLRTEVIGKDGTPKGGEKDVFYCPACERAMALVPDAGDTCKLQLVATHRSVQAWRTL